MGGRGGVVATARGANRVEYKLVRDCSRRRLPTASRAPNRPEQRAMRGERATSGYDCPLVTTGELTMEWIGMDGGSCRMYRSPGQTWRDRWPRSSWAAYGALSQSSTPRRSNSDSTSAFEGRTQTRLIIYRLGITGPKPARDMQSRSITPDLGFDTPFSALVTRKVAHMHMVVYSLC